MAAAAAAAAAAVGTGTFCPLGSAEVITAVIPISLTAAPGGAPPRGATVAGTKRRQHPVDGSDDASDDAADTEGGVKGRGGICRHTGAGSAGAGDSSGAASMATGHSAGEVVENTGVYILSDEVDSARQFASYTREFGMHAAEAHTAAVMEALLAVTFPTESGGTRVVFDNANAAVFPAASIPASWRAASQAGMLRMSDVGRYHVVVFPPFPFLEASISTLGARGTTISHFIHLVMQSAEVLQLEGAFGLGKVSKLALAMELCMPSSALSLAIAGCPELAPLGLTPMSRPGHLCAYRTVDDLPSDAAMQASTYADEPAVFIDIGERGGDTSIGVPFLRDDRVVLVWVELKKLDWPLPCFIIATTQTNLVDLRAENSGGPSSRAAAACPRKIDSVVLADDLLARCSLNLRAVLRSEAESTTAGNILLSVAIATQQRFGGAVAATAMKAQRIAAAVAAEHKAADAREAAALAAIDAETTAALAAADADKRAALAAADADKRAALAAAGALQAAALAAADADQRAALAAANADKRAALAAADAEKVAALAALRAELEAVRAMLAASRAPAAPDSGSSSVGR